MTSLAIVSLISLLGWLALNVSALRSYRIGRKRMVRMALLWIGIFAGVTWVFSSLS